MNQDTTRGIGCDPDASTPRSNQSRGMGICIPFKYIRTWKTEAVASSSGNQNPCWPDSIDQCPRGRCRTAMVWSNQDHMLTKPGTNQASFYGMTHITT